MAGSYGRISEKAAPPKVLNGISGGDLGTAGATQQLVFDEYVAPFDVGRLDDLFVSYLFPDSEDFSGTENDGGWPQGWHGFDQAVVFGDPCPANPFSILMDSLTRFTMSLPTDHPVVAPNDRLAKASALFSKENVERFIGHYFRDYCPHSPILYPGTFQASSTSPFLLTVIVVTGALFSPGAADIESARAILDLVEEYVFSNVNFKKLLTSPNSITDPDDVEAWQALQAAFFITQVQLREGSVVKKKLTRNARFDEIICAVRALGLVDARNPFFHNEPPTPDRFQWSQYGESETKVRLVCGVFNLDASFSILYNMVPRLFAEEMNIDMPGPADAFFADSAQDCYEASLKVHGVQTLTLSALCDAFMQEKWDDQIRSSMQSISLLHLFILILALLQILWLSPYRPKKEQTMERISLALDRWKQVWDVQNTNLTPRQRERYGFLKTAPLEFWQIATVLVKKKATRLDRAVDHSTRHSQSEEIPGSCQSCAHALLENVNKEPA
ncbi:hypothetical protein H2200_003458 [Cladophialophora chaetospira]|uniref:Xylanolytic transcriptional activator regulatory domain-containing protein n=1 Tax=Cladophialophora chaetospira TaxID=386627 RepID=A0AA38XI36_9EURO|nr:hypothetical protein H2200_003458 [Cladophialophora chaetospira]